MNTTPERHDALAAVRIPEYRSLMMGRFCFVMGLRMLSTLVGWWLYELTSAPLALGLIGLAEVIPALSLALYAGHVIDISEKRKLLLRGIFFYFLAGCVLLFLSTNYITGHTGKNLLIVAIYFVIFCTGIIRAFVGPSFSAIVGQTVPKPLLANATTWNQGTFLSASVLGHATGGFIIAAFSHTGTLIFVVSLMAISFLTLTNILPKPAVHIAGEKRTWESVKEGLAFVFSTKEILGALTLDLFAVLFGGAVALVPVYARDILKVGSIGFGWLNAATDIGAITIVVLLALFPVRKNQGRLLFYAVAGFGLCIIVFGISKIFWVSFLALMCGGILDGISVVIRGTILQLKTPDEMRGRVMSVNSMFINSSNELGQFESGLMAKLMGVVPSVVFGGTMTVLIVIATWFKAPALKKMEY